MFNNIGDKLMTVAVWVAIVGCAGAAVLGFLYFGSSIVLGILILIFGCISSLLLSMVLYGLGHLICNSDEMLQLRRGEEGYSPSTVEDRKSTAPAKVVPDEEGKITCPVCGSVQKEDRIECWSCGQRFNVMK